MVKKYNKVLKQKVKDLEELWEILNKAYYIYEKHMITSEAIIKLNELEQRVIELRHYYKDLQNENFKEVN